MLEQNLAKIVEKGVHLDAIFGKWIVGTLVMIYLYHSINFSQLNRELKRITPKVLSSKLKDLEEMGLIGKKILLEHPLRVEYYRPACPGRSSG